MFGSKFGLNVGAGLVVKQFFIVKYFPFLLAVKTESVQDHAYIAGMNSEVRSIKRGLVLILMRKIF